MRMRVSGKCDPKNLAGAIAGFFGGNAEGKLELDCIGAAAVNCASKSVAISSYMLGGKRMKMTPRFEFKENVPWRDSDSEEIEPSGRNITGLVFEVGIESGDVEV